MSSIDNGDDNWWPTGEFRLYSPDHRYFAEKLQQKFCSGDDFRHGIWRDVPDESIPVERFFRPKL